ncbi:MAG: PD-(D/E)XK nuclease family protein [Gammaproteobacteria bacterium]
MKFLYGHLVETLVLWLAKEAGHTVERQQECVEVDGVRGAIDAVVDGYLVDVKSMSSYSFNSLEKYGLANDPFGYSGQLAGYKQGLGTSVKDGMYILGVDKQNGHVAAVRVTTDLDAEERIAEIREDSQSDEPPPRPYTDKPEGASGNRMLGIECSYCAFKRTCWPGLRTFLYSNGPKFLTHVEMPPRVQEVSSEV